MMQKQQETPEPLQLPFVEWTQEVDEKALAASMMFLMFVVIVIALTMLRRLYKATRRRAAMTPDQRNYDDFVRRLENKGESELRKMGKRAEKEEPAIKSLLDQRRSPEKQPQLTSDEINRRLKLVLCIILGLRKDASDNVIWNACVFIMLFVIHFPTRDMQIQKAISTIRKILGWYYTKLAEPRPDMLRLEAGLGPGGLPQRTLSSMV
jgi:hypothetical protein